MAQQPLIKPAQLDQLPFFTEEKKTYYKQGLAKLWHAYENNPQGSPTRQDAENKIRAASQKIMAELSQAQKGGRPQSGGGPQQRPPTSGSMGSAGQQNGAGTPQTQPGGEPRLQVTPSIRAVLQTVTIHVPNNLPPNQHSAYKHRWYQQAAGHLQQRDYWVAKGKEATAQMNQCQKSGQQVPQQITDVLNNAKRGVMDANHKWDLMTAKNESERQANLQRSGQAQGGGVQQGGGQGGQAGGQQHSQQVNGGQQAPDMHRSNTQGTDVKQEPRTSMSPQQPQGGFPQQQSMTGNQGAPSQNTPQPQQAPPQPQQQPQHPPQTAAQSQPPQNLPQQHPQQQQQFQNQQQRPSMPQQMSQGQMPQGQMPQQQQQHQQAPAPAMPNQQQQPPQRPQALSQQAAMAQAAQSYESQRQMPNQPQSNQPQVPNGLPFNVPHSATQPTPTSAYPQGPPSLQATPGPNNKFPIAKTLQIDPRIQQPVQGPPSRPTYGNTGMLQQPGTTRAPPFTLEGEGDRVLSKRKLDELVRQVTGAESAAAALDPEVEESILQIADDFVDDVITRACKLAKLRPGAQLEVKDFQIVLERNYGIRIPGFALDEVRTVRKFQPAPQWQSKMGAIQTAKTLGGVGKGDS